jgi:hypothetical protein
MKSWEDRPQEVANLLNPAFCGRVIYHAIDGYGGHPHREMPYALSFLVLPLILHPATRDTIKATTRHLQVWLNMNQQIKVGLATRARTLVPYAREAVTFLCQSRILYVNEENASLVVCKSLRRRKQTRNSAERTAGGDVADCTQKAVVLGRWLSRVNSPAAIYASFGLMP